MTYCIFQKTQNGGGLDTTPNFKGEPEQQTTTVTSIMESALNLCWVPFSHCNSCVQNKRNSTDECNLPVAIPSEVYIEGARARQMPRCKLSGVVSKNHTFQTIETALNSSYQSSSSRIDNNSSETQCIPRTIIFNYSDMDVSESSTDHDSKGYQIQLKRSISSMSCPSSFRNISRSSSIYNMLDDSQDIDISVSSVTAENNGSKLEKSACLLLESKDSLLSFDGSSHSQGSSDVLDLLSFASEDKNLMSNTDLNYLCEESIQSSYYSGRYDESLSVAVDKG